MTSGLQAMRHGRFKNSLAASGGLFNTNAVRPRILCALFISGGLLAATTPEPRIEVCPVPSDPISLHLIRPNAEDSIRAGTWYQKAKTQAEWQGLLQNSDPEVKACAEFLLQNLPVADLGSIKPKFLQENIQLALQARHAQPWATNVPWEVFLNDVLPYACLDEDREDWRSDFTTRFGNLVKNASSLEQAAKIINQAIEKNVGVKYSTRRRAANQSPHDSMRQGVASCSGLSILLCDALRSVGIPARIAGVPTWATINGNHNWVEVWLGPTNDTNDPWHITEYNPDAKGWDHAWFMDRVANANPMRPETWIYASSWQRTNLAFPLVWDLNSRQVYGINRTSAYLKLVGGHRQTIPEDQCLISVRTYDKNHRVTASVNLAQESNPTLATPLQTKGEEKDLNDVAQFTVPAKAGQVTLQWGDLKKTVTPEGGKEIVIELQRP